ncbi:hypothetical protein MAE02_53340 [Microvirga aerophila]|uniref:Uncharacterized protein n=1 Tax=Microvirga aerophila TaxID=670291 RepID=A0A512C095_9HYPH|nr:hypothetical protein MAE02_53340 [Microvirga aerophila]
MIQRLCRRLIDMFCNRPTCLVQLLPLGGDIHAPEGIVLGEAYLEVREPITAHTPGKADDRWLADLRLRRKALGTDPRRRFDVGEDYIRDVALGTAHFRCQEAHGIDQTTHLAHRGFVP